MKRTVTYSLFAILIACQIEIATAQLRSAGGKVVAIDLPFAATQLAVSEDGERAAVWDAIRNSSDSPSLAAIDLKNGKLVAQSFLPAAVSDIVVGDDVYVADAIGIRRLSFDMLKPLGAYDNGGKSLGFPNTRTGMRGDASRLMRITHKRLSVGPRLRLKLPELTLIENYEHDVNTAESWLDGRCSFGWFSEGILWDESMTRPLLLAWPYEFKRTPWQDVLRHSSRDPGDFQIGVGTWHPFPTKLSARPDRKVIATATSPDIAATLGVVASPGGYHLASFGLDNGKFITSVPLAPSDGPTQVSRGNSPSIATGGERFVVLLQGRLHVGPLEQLRPVGGSLPFHLVPQQSTFVVPIDKPITIRYEAAGATKFQLSSRSLGHERESFEATSGTGEFTIAIAESLDRILNDAAGLAANLNQGRDIADNHARAEFYAAPSRAAFQRLFGREANGVPLPVDFQITANGVDFETATLRHDLLVEVPLNRFEDALDRKYPHGRSPWKKPIEEFDLNRYPAVALPPSNQAPLDVYLRALWATPHPTVADQQLRDAARQAKATGDKRLHEKYIKWSAGNQWRTWTDNEGRTADALLVQYFADQVTLRTRKGFEVTFDVSKLSATDRKYLEDSPEPTSPNDSDGWREFIFAESLRAVNQFHAVRKSFPPRALKDDAGQPRLSWRVLLLPELGYGELFALFRLDEPWNSEHNRQLVPYLPNNFVVDPSSAKDGKTTFFTVSSPLSAMPTIGTTDLRSLGTDAQFTILFVEAVASRAAEWTKPVDLQLYEFTDPLSVVRSRNGKILVGLIDGRTLQIPVDTSSDDWRYAVNRGDSIRTLGAIAN